MKKYVPEKVDIDKLIRDCTTSQIKEFHPDKMKWLLSEIAEKPLASSGFAEIHSRRFQDYVHNYKEYLEQFIDNGIIEVDLSFSYVQKSVKLTT